MSHGRIHLTKNTRNRNTVSAVFPARLQGTWRKITMCESSGVFGFFRCVRRLTRRLPITSDFKNCDQRTASVELEGNGGKLQSKQEEQTIVVLIETQHV